MKTDKYQFLGITGNFPHKIGKKKLNPAGENVYRNTGNNLK